MDSAIFPKNSRFSLFPIFGILLSVISSGNAAGVRCELVRDSCLDLFQITDQTITVPSNTTRIQKNGLAICLPSLITFQAIDLVFILDMSGSMVETDPEKLVSPASIAVLNLLDSLSPNSNVGFMGFSSGVCDGTKKDIEKMWGAGKKYEEKKSTLVFPAPLNSPGQKEKLLEPMTFSPDNFLTDCGNIPRRGDAGTNYYRPFLLAEEWLNQLDTRNKQFILFLTDGGNNLERRKYWEMLDRVDSTNFPIVNAIFVNWEVNPYLLYMTTKTNGQYAQIRDFSNVKEVMMAMLGASLVPNSPDLTSITKNGNPLMQTRDHLQIDGTNFQVNLSHDLALDLGANPLSINVKASGFGDRMRNLNIQAGGPPETTTGAKDLDNNVFDAVCYDASTITATDKSSAAPIQQLGVYRETGFGIALNTPADNIKAVVNVQGAGDAEKIELPDKKASGYRGPAAFTRTPLKTPDNGIVEGLEEEILQLFWAHPHDPRDTALALLSLLDNRADTIQILFTDMQDNPIAAIDDLAGPQFKVIVINNKAKGPFPVQLTSSHGDSLVVTVHQIAPKTFQAVVPFGFTIAVNRGNVIIEGVFDPTSSENQTGVTASVNNITNNLLLQKIYVPVENSWIIDKDGDGRADMVYIRFEEALHALPTAVTDIHWPSGTSEAKRAPAEDSPQVNPLSFVDNDSALVRIDLSQDPFNKGATSASPVSQPTLTLPPEGIKTVIQDSVKPIILSVKKIPSNFSRYARASDSLTFPFPDTLIVTLSEAIKPFPNAVEPWKSLLLVTKNDQGMPVNILTEPEILSNDGRMLLAIVDSRLGPNTIKTGDSISLNPAAPYRDEKSNYLAPLKTIITGDDSRKEDFAAAWRGGPIAGNQTDITRFSKVLQIPIITVTDSIVGYLEEEAVSEWVPPLGIDPNTGDVNINLQMGNCADLTANPIQFPAECLASMLVLTGVSDGRYIAEITIYDHLGKHIRSLKQAFGYCGELENPARVTEGGLIMNDLVWNLKDSNGDEVGSGVYIWRVILQFADRQTKVRVFKMGFIRKFTQPADACFGGF